MSHRHHRYRSYLSIRTRYSFHCGNFGHDPNGFPVPPDESLHQSVNPIRNVFSFAKSSRCNIIFIINAVTRDGAKLSRNRLYVRENIAIVRSLSFNRTNPDLFEHSVIARAVDIVLDGEINSATNTLKPQRFERSITAVGRPCQNTKTACARTDLRPEALTFVRVSPAWVRP